MRVAIIQSSYVPWKGFFDLIGRADLYVVLDGAQYVKRHWHNRNRIMTPNGPSWLTIPVATKSRFAQPIDEVGFAAPWADKHWRAIELAYRKSPFFTEEAPALKAVYEAAERLDRLTDVNTLFLKALMERLDISTTMARDSEFAPQGARTARLLDICMKVGATNYLSGPSAREYLDESPFAAAGIAVEWMSYGPYKSYAQRGPAFEHAVSVIDLLFSTGPAAASYCSPMTTDPAAETAETGHFDNP
ncbi:WbqC family protein [Bradyrhizobium australiense]|uniref:WbqC family protein n=1 Tax=Bradyrhizobium australiense TaxID=2721161 RepID=A0A7Y4GX31_9BRAD|nr:WbqC family protein [Bradyrhizobium australiense]NOJ43554.1 WbqC family protein [Bradyrhizobium australiense]